MNDDDDLPKLIYSRSIEANPEGEKPVFNMVEQEVNEDLNRKRLSVVEEEDEKMESSTKQHVLKYFSEKTTIRTFKTKRVIDSLEILRNNRDAKLILKSEENFSRFKKTLMEYGYEDISLLGEGGTGLVLRARNIKKDEIVALKFQYIGEEGVLEEDFKNEAEIMHAHSKRLAEDLTLKSLKIYNKVILTDRETSTKLSVIEMEIAKDTLENIIRKMRKEKKQFNSDQISKIFTDLIEALYYLHSQNIAHNDIKPANIFLIENSFTLADFGICRRINVAETHAKRGCTLEVRMPLCGTYKYMSPQMRRGFESYEKCMENNKSTTEFEVITLDCFKSDIYSLGIVILELISIGDIDEKVFANAVYYRDASFEELIKRYKIASQDETYVQIEKGFLKIPNLLEFMLRESEEDRCTILDLCSYCNLKDCFIAPVVTPLLEVFTPIVEQIDERTKRISYVTKPVIYEGETCAAGFQKNGWGVLYRLEKEKKGDKKTEKKVLIYEGNWKQDLPHGNGSMRLGDMFVFKGKFKMGMRHGEGMLFFKDQLVQEGFWVSNTFPQYCGMVYDNLDDMFEFIPTGQFIPLPYINTKLAWKQDRDLKGKIVIDFYLHAETPKDRKFLRDRLHIFFSLKNEKVIKNLRVKRKVLSDGPSIWLRFSNFSRYVKFFFRGLREHQDEVEIIRLCDEIITINVINSFTLDLWKNQKLSPECLQNYHLLMAKATSRISSVGLVLGNTGVANAQLTHFLPKLASRNAEAKYTLTELDLTNNKDITDEWLGMLADSKSGVRLLALNMSGCSQITDEGLTKLIYSSVAKNIQTLNVDNNENISAELLRAIVGRKSKENITSLSLSRCSRLFRRDRESWFALKSSKSISSEPIFPQSLQELDLSYTMVTDELLLKFAREVQKLAKLSLRGCASITDAGVQKLCSSPSLKTLHHLDISMCNLMNAVLEYIGKSQIAELKTIKLDGFSALDERGMFSLVKEKVFVKLEHLYLAESGACGKCLKLLQKHPNVSNLKTLSIANCKKITQESLKKFLVCGKFTSLRDLNLDSIEFGFRQLMATLERKESPIGSLVSLSIRKNNIESRDTLLRFIDSDRLKKLNKLVTDPDVKKSLASNLTDLKQKTLKVNKEILVKSDRSKPRLIIKDLSSSDKMTNRANPHLKIDNEVMKSLLYHGETVSKIAKLNLEGFTGITDVGIKYLATQAEKLYNLKVLNLKGTMVGSAGIKLILTSFLVYTLEVLDTRDCDANDGIDISQIRREKEESFLFELRSSKPGKGGVSHRKICLIRNLYEEVETSKSLGKHVLPFKRKENILVWIGDKMIDSTNERLNSLELQKNRCTFFILQDQAFLKNFQFDDYYKALVAISQEISEDPGSDDSMAEANKDYVVLSCGLTLKQGSFRFELATVRRTEKLREESIICMLNSINKFKPLKSVKVLLQRLEESGDNSISYLLCKAFQELTKLKKMEILLLGRNIQPTAVDRATMLISGLGTLTELKDVRIQFEKGILNRDHIDNLNLEIFSQVECFDLSMDECGTKLGAIGRVGIKLGTILEKFLKLRHLKLALKANKLERDGGIYISKAIAKMSQLSVLHLRLQRNSLGDSVKSLATALENLRNLKELYLYIEDNAIGKESSNSLGFALSKLVNLTILHIDIVKNKIENEGAISIGLALDDLHMLKELCLNLRFNNIQPKGLETLRKHLPHLSSLERLTLNLHDNNLGGKEIFGLLSECSKLVTLKYFDLDIRDNDIDRDLYSVFNSTVSLMTKLEALHLKLQEKSISTYGINSLVSALSKLEHLESFQLKTRNIQCCKDLIINLAKSERLFRIKHFHFHIPECAVFKEDISNLANILLKMKSLEELSINLEKNRLEAEQARQLAVAIGDLSNMKLLELELLDNSIGEAADTFLDTVSELLLLENLKIDLRNNHIDISCIKNIGKFRLLSNLRFLHLNLAHNMLEREAAIYICASLKGLADIGTLILNLSENDIELNQISTIRNIVSPLINVSLDL